MIRVEYGYIKYTVDGQEYEGSIIRHMLLFPIKPDSIS